VQYPGECTAYILCRLLTPICWFTETKPHTRDPKPTTLDPNDPKAKQTHIPKSESFEEYMKRRAAEGKK
jgi:hypothetical protein